MTLFVVQLLGHAAAVVTFAAVALYGFQYRNALRRNLRRSRYLYRLILATGGIFALVHLFRLYTLAVGSPSSGVFAWMDVAAEYPSVIAQSIIIFYLIANKIIVTRAAHSRKVLVIGAHPEEYELAAGATLAKMRDAGYQIYGLVLSGGEKADHAAPGTEFLGIGSEERRDFAENSLKDHLDDLTDAIRETIASVGPQIILTTSCHDRSPDRQAVFAATLAAGADQNAILSYESRSAGQEFSPSLYVDVADYVEVKRQALQRLERPPAPLTHPEQVRAQLAYHGLQAKVAYAEGFEVVRLLSSCLADL